MGITIVIHLFLTQEAEGPYRPSETQLKLINTIVQCYHNDHTIT